MHAVASSCLQHSFLLLQSFCEQTEGLSKMLRTIGSDSDFTMTTSQRDPLILRVKSDVNISPAENLGSNINLAASFPGLPTVQFLIACSMQKWRGKAWSILSCEWCFVYLGRQRRGGVPDWKNTFHTRILHILKQGAVRFSLCERSNWSDSSTWSRNYKIRPEAHFFFHQGPHPPPLSTYVIK